MYLSESLVKTGRLTVFSKRGVDFRYIFSQEVSRLLVKGPKRDRILFLVCRFGSLTETPLAASGLTRPPLFFRQRRGKGISAGMHLLDSAQVRMIHTSQASSLSLKS